MILESLINDPLSKEEEASLRSMLARGELTADNLLASRDLWQKWLVDHGWPDTITMEHVEVLRKLRFIRFSLEMLGAGASKRD